MLTRRVLAITAQAAYRTLSPAVGPLHVLARKPQQTSRLAVHRSFATENTDVDPKLVEIIYKMQTSPAVMEAIGEFERLVRLKGFDRQTGFGQFYSFMKDKEIEQALQKIMIEMDNAGIRISADIVQPLLQSMSKNFSGTPFK